MIRHPAGLSLLTLAVLCARVGAPRALTMAAVLWGLLIIALGMTQMRILPGPAHWVVRTVHLLTGAVGMGLAGALTARLGATAHPSGTLMPMEESGIGQLG